MVADRFLGDEALRLRSQILALRVYNMPTVSTISGPRLLVVHSVYKPQTDFPCVRVDDGTGPFLGQRGPSAPFPNIGTSRLQHADGVYN